MGRRGGRRPREGSRGLGRAGDWHLPACGLPTPSQRLLPGQLLPDSLHLERIHCTGLAFRLPPAPQGLCTTSPSTRVPVQALSGSSFTSFWVSVATPPPESGPLTPPPPPPQLKMLSFTP